MNTEMNTEMNFARSIKMLILAVTFMGGAVLTPILTQPTQAQVLVGSTDSRRETIVFNVVNSALDERSNPESADAMVAEESASEDADSSSDQPEYKYVPIRRY